MSKGYLFINIFITKSCNLRCQHCYHENFTNPDNELDFEYIASEINSLSQNWCINHINILGGEPFMDRNLFFKIEKIREFYNGKINIGTNGTIISDDIISNLKKYDINIIQVSLESHDSYIHDSIRGKGSFEKTTKNISRLTNNGFFVSTRTTLSKINYKDINQIVKLGEKLNVNQVSFNRYIPVNPNENIDVLDSKDTKEINQTIRGIKSKVDVIIENPCNLIVNNNDKANELLEKHSICGCSAGISSISIDLTGDIYFCTTIQNSIANLRDKKLLDIWNDSNIYDRMRKRNFDGKCGICKYKSICGGCRAMANYINGSIYGEDPTCILVHND